MTCRITVLGGSTPFTLALFEALAEKADRLAGLSMTLFGRDRVALGLVGRSGASRLGGYGWQIETTTDLEASLDGADIVLHQIRYGGLEGRREDEALCQSLAIPSDETLGLGGLNALLRTSLEMRHVGEALVRRCPHAWIVNLTNPLSAVTTLLSRSHGLRNCVGVCELPAATAREIARVLDVPLAALEWAYTGLNHRGFLHDLVLDDADALPALLERLPAGGLAGVQRQWIEELHAVPLKYYRLLRDPGNAPKAGRAAYLMTLRREILAQLAEDTEAMPASLGKRAMPWYREAVLPVILALTGDRPLEVMASAPDDGLVARERKLLLGREGFRAIDQPPAPAPLHDLLVRLEAQEERAVQAAQSRSADALREAVHLDPLIPDHLETACVRELERRL